MEEIFKKSYRSPKLEIVDLTEDIVTASVDVEMPGDWGDGGEF